MDINELIVFMNIAEKLKCNTRHSWTSSGRHESVAEHSWRMGLLAMAVADEFNELDMNKVIKMCLIHDLGEAITGDIPTFYKTASDEVIELNAIDQLLSTVSGSFKHTLKTLFEEMDELKTPEARLYKCIDKCEVVLQHNEAALDTWIELEYELNQTHGQKECEEFSYMKRLREKLKLDTLAKLNELSAQ